jgi:hypothetical protein
LTPSRKGVLESLTSSMGKPQYPWTLKPAKSRWEDLCPV